jgi:stalled ribosome rescue protein Dom34
MEKENMSHYHAVVWLDHTQAHVIHISPDDVEKSIVHPASPHHKLHSRLGTLGSGRAPEEQAYYHAVAEALTGAQEILVVGPAQAKLQLIKHLHAHDPATADKVVGVETVDHPTDGQLVAYARKYFVAKDRMLP